MPQSANRFDTEYAFGLIQSAAEEVRTDSSYFFDNRHRPDGSGLVVQLTLEGAAFFGQGPQRRLVKPGNAMIFSHDEDSSYGYPPEAKQNYRHLYVEFTDCNALRTIFNKIRDDFGAIVSVPDKSEGRDLLNEIVERFRTGHFTDRYQESELLYRLLIAIYRQQIEGTRNADPIEFGHHLIRNRFRKDSNLKEIAQLCGVSREYFSREFHSRYGGAPGQMLKQLRLEHAKLLLTTTRIPVADISAASGFANLGTFGRLFKRRFGRSPGEFRGVKKGPRAKP
jgi:AraC-like DNA-binding protein